MSAAALEAKRQQVEDYFSLHPDSQDVQIVGGDTSFSGLFDNAVRDHGANDERQVMMPHIQCYSGNCDVVTPGVTRVIVGTTEYAVQAKQCDEDGSFVGHLWLV